MIGPVPIEERKLPYLTQDKRDEIDFRIRDLHNDTFRRSVSFGEPVQDGELNYVITRLIHEHLGKKPRYEDYNAVIGVLESAKLELYRMYVGPFESQKRFDNGDV